MTDEPDPTPEQCRQILIRDAQAKLQRQVDAIPHAAESTDFSHMHRVVESIRQQADVLYVLRYPRET